MSDIQNDIQSIKDDIELIKNILLEKEDLNDETLMLLKEARNTPREKNVDLNDL